MSATRPRRAGFLRPRVAHPATPAHRTGKPGDKHGKHEQTSSLDPSLVDCGGVLGRAGRDRRGARDPGRIGLQPRRTRTRARHLAAQRCAAGRRPRHALQRHAR
ncbi:hypothetical protein BGLA2_310077 [Burkholderia gladioli]|nr:hypothetical protein BGLA2_310077 [Burkholderia gladioli]